MTLPGTWRWHPKMQKLLHPMQHASYGPGMCLYLPPPTHLDIKCWCQQGPFFGQINKSPAPILPFPKLPLWMCCRFFFPSCSIARQLLCFHFRKAEVGGHCINTVSTARFFPLCNLRKDHMWISLKSFFFIPCYWHFCEISMSRAWNLYVKLVCSSFLTSDVFLFCFYIVRLVMF